MSLSLHYEWQYNGCMKKLPLKFCGHFNIAIYNNELPTQGSEKTTLRLSMPALQLSVELVTVFTKHLDLKQEKSELNSGGGSHTYSNMATWRMKTRSTDRRA
jgi:hypothetical protein